MIYVFLANGFEEIEALTPVDILRRAGHEVRTVGVGGKRVVGAHGILVEADIADSEYTDQAPTMVILPGGIPGTPNLEASSVVMGALDRAAATDAYIAAICAAPTILGHRGLLGGKQATCYPGMEGELLGASVAKGRVVQSGKIITGAGMGVALAFSLKLVEILSGEEEAARLRRAVIAD